MDTRLRNVTIAIILAVIGSLLLLYYFNGLKAKIEEGQIMEAVYVAKSPILAGTNGSDLLLKVEKQNIPKKYVAADAVTNEMDIKDKTLVISLSAGEQLTKNNFRQTSVSEISYRLAGDKMAMSIPVDEVVGVAGNIKAGDHVALFATLSPGPGGSDITKMFLNDVEVLLSSESDLKTGRFSSGGIKKTLTLAVTVQEAEKIIFAAEKGKIWVALLPFAKTGGDLKAEGQTMETIFIR